MNNKRLLLISVGALLTIAFAAAVLLQSSHGLDDAIAGMACVAPLVVFLSLPKKRLAAPWEPSFGLIAAGGFFVFFLAGLVQYWLNGREIGFAIAGPIDSAVVRDTLVGCALIACMLILGDSLGRTRIAKPANLSSVGSVNMLILSQVLWALACYGCYDVAKSLGGLAAAAAKLSVHDRNVGIENAGTLGMSLWATFALPAVTALLVVCFDATRRKRVRMLTATQAFVILGFGVTMFGSRLLLVLSLVALVFSFYRMRGRGPSFKSAISVLFLLMAVSTMVLGGRAEALNTAHDASILDSVGYSIFDVSVAAAESQEELRPKIGSPERALTVLSGAIPGSGARSAEISDSRIDVIVVKAIGTAAQANNSGLPPSLPTSLLLGFPLALAMLMALALGAALGLFTRWLASLESYLAVLLLGLWGSFLFNGFKGGDLPLDIGSEARRWFYIIILYGVIFVFTRGKDRWHGQIQNGSLRDARVSGHNADLRRE